MKIKLHWRHRRLSSLKKGWSCLTLVTFSSQPASKLQSKMHAARLDSAPFGNVDWIQQAISRSSNVDMTLSLISEAIPYTVLARNVKATAEQILRRLVRIKHMLWLSAVPFRSSQNVESSCSSTERVASWFITTSLRWSLESVRTPKARHALLRKRSFSYLWHELLTRHTN